MIGLSILKLVEAHLERRCRPSANNSKQYDNKYEVALPKGDTWKTDKKGQMVIPASQPDNVQNATDRVSPAYKNANTPWWDGSQIYGDSEEQTQTLRKAQPHGKLAMDKEGLETFLPRDKHGLPETGFRENVSELPVIAAGCFIQPKAISFRLTCADPIVHTFSGG